VWNDTAAALQLTTPPVINMNNVDKDAVTKPADHKSVVTGQHDMAL
jgi:malate dehydrogenase (quinone)